MDPNYKPIQQQAEKLHFKFKDVCDNHEDQLARWLEEQTKEVREDIERNKPPRAVEDRIKNIQQQLRHAKAQPVPALSPDDADLLFDSYEQLRGKLRGLPNY
jgi:hypothetical protein